MEPNHPPQNPNFILKVKLISNQVHQFQINPGLTIKQLKQLIHAKIGMDINRMRIVFGGKQLLDQHYISQYISQSGMTVHLIQKSSERTTQPSIPLQPPSINIQGLVNALRQGSNQSQSTLNNSTGRQFSQIASSTDHPTISYSQIDQLSSVINDIHLPQPSTNSNQQFITVEGVKKYLKQLQFETAKYLTKLNGSIAMMEEGYISHLQDLVPVFESLNEANRLAINYIGRLDGQSQDTIADNSHNFTQIIISRNSDGNQQIHAMMVEEVDEQEVQEHNIQLDFSVGINGTDMNKTIEQTIQNNNQASPEIVRCFYDFTGLDCFKAIMSNDFNSISSKQPLIRKRLLQLLQKKQKSQLIQTFTKEIAILLCPANDPKIADPIACERQGKLIIQNFIIQWLSLTLEQHPQHYTQIFLKGLKDMFVKILNNNINHIQNHEEGHAFDILKRQIILVIPEAYPGEMIYLLMEKSLKRIYAEYKEMAEFKDEMMD